MGMGYVRRHCCSSMGFSAKIFLLSCHVSRFSICVSVGIVLLIHACSVGFTVPEDLHMLSKSNSAVLHVHYPIPLLLERAFKWNCGPFCPWEMRKLRASSYWCETKGKEGGCKFPMSQLKLLGEQHVALRMAAWACLLWVAWLLLLEGNADNDYQILSSWQLTKKRNLSICLWKASFVFSAWSLSA